MGPLKGVKIGKNVKIEPNVIVGYLPSRKIKNMALKIGDNSAVRSGTVIYAGSLIGSHLETGHNVIIREENRIGSHFNIWSNSVVDYGCTIGDNVRIHCGCYVSQFTKIGNNVFLAPGVMLANDKYPGDPESKKKMQGPTIEDNVNIGINVTILPYIRIGKNALVGGGSVVTKDVPPGCVVVGNPAKVVGKITQLNGIPGLIEEPYKSEKV